MRTQEKSKPRRPKLLKIAFWIVAAVLFAFFVSPYLGVFGYPFGSPIVGEIELAFMPLERKVNVLINSYDHDGSPGGINQFTHRASPGQIAKFGEAAIPYLLKRLGDDRLSGLAPRKGLLAAETLWRMGEKGRDAMRAYLRITDDPLTRAHVLLIAVLHEEPDALDDFRAFLDQQVSIPPDERKKSLLYPLVSSEWAIHEVTKQHDTIRRLQTLMGDLLGEYLRKDREKWGVKGGRGGT